jgi:hypothetical protein
MAPACDQIGSSAWSYVSENRCSDNSPLPNDEVDPIRTSVHVPGDSSDGNLDDPHLMEAFIASVHLCFLPTQTEVVGTLSGPCRMTPRTPVGVRLPPAQIARSGGFLRAQSEFLFVVK